MNPSTPLQVAPHVWQIRLEWTQVYVLSDGTQFSLVDTAALHLLSLRKHLEAQARN